ncbi:MAG: transcriptional regulator [Verrucomicrobia bacterium]|nr:transcriptional regulator [Verrucomicrobiota bacterium]
MNTSQEDYFISLVEELRKLPHETEWVEFKHNKADPDMIGERLSALANSAALEGKATAYMTWGIEDGSHHILGTSFKPHASKVGNEALENWLLHSLSPKIDFTFRTLTIDEKHLVLLEITRAQQSPVQFKGIEYIRIGSYTKKLKDHPERERNLWRVFEQTPFENLSAKENVSAEEVVRLLDYPSYFDLMGLDLPTNRDHIIERLEEENLIARTDSGSWNILNLGALLFAKELTSFTTLSRKSLRVIHYQGDSRLETLHEQVGNRGYACGFEGLIEFINARIPHNEILGSALRKEVPMFPEVSIRELVANALIHQDFFQTGTGPMIEIFDNRLEITNPGIPLIDTDRFLDSPPKSRNEALASLMRRVGICEERGSGIDKVVHETELFQLPAPIFETTPQHTRSILFAHKPFEEMSTTERIHACYLHACLRYLMHDYMSNESLRERFGLTDEKIARASRIITATKEKGLIVPAEIGQSNKFARYLPHWAA